MIIFKIVFRPFMRTGRHPGNLALRIIYGLKLKTVSCYMRNLSVIYNCALESWRIVAAGVSPFADVLQVLKKPGVVRLPLPMLIR